MAAGFGLLLAACGAAVYGLTAEALKHEFDNRLRAEAAAIMARSEQSATGLHLEQPPAITHKGRDEMAPTVFEIWHGGSHSVVRSRDLSDGDLPRAQDAETRARFRNLRIGGIPFRALQMDYTPKVDDEDQANTKPSEATIVIAADRRAILHAESTLALVLIGTGVIALAATVPLVRASLRRGHAPIADLARQAGGITSASLNARFATEKLPEELQPISARLNDLLERLEASFARERRFSSDLAHELRTPLAELRTAAEVGIKFGESEMAEAHRETLAVALQMQALVTRLLELSRCEDGGFAARGEAVPLAALVNEIWRPLALRAAEKNLAARMNIPSEVVVTTDAALLRSIMSNLLVNSVTYSPPGSQMEMRWDAAARAFSAANVTDDLRSEDIPHLFERLWRKDKSRTDGAHSGLGLSLAEALARTLGLELSASLDAERRLTMKLAGLRLWTEAVKGEDHILADAAPARQQQESPHSKNI